MKKEEREVSRMTALVAYELRMDHGGDYSKGATAEAILSMGNRQ